MTEETTTGVNRLYRCTRRQARLPAINVNDSVTKSKFDNLYGCRESLVDGIKRATDVMVAGKVAVSRATATSARGRAGAARAVGAQRVDHGDRPHLRAQAAMEGYRVVTMEDAATRPTSSSPRPATSTSSRTSTYEAMKDQAIVVQHRPLRQRDRGRGAQGYPSGRDQAAGRPRDLPDGKRIILLAEGRLVNLGCGTGHPSYVMSSSFTNQVMAQIELSSPRDLPVLTDFFPPQGSRRLRRP